jgi:hypothetical protein
VLIDQMISAIMVMATSNLSAAKLKSDWQKLQSIPAFPEMEKDHAHLKGLTWPLCYILAAQSDSAEDLKEAWKQVCREGHTLIYSGGIRERFSNERIAKNEAQTATANARAAEAEQRAVEARLELENTERCSRFEPIMFLVRYT